MFLSHRLFALARARVCVCVCSLLLVNKYEILWGSSLWY